MILLLLFPTAECPVYGRGPFWARRQTVCFFTAGKIEPYLKNFIDVFEYRPQFPKN